MQLIYFPQLNYKKVLRLKACSKSTSSQEQRDSVLPLPPYACSLGYEEYHDPWLQAGMKSGGNSKGYIYACGIPLNILITLVF